jgi:hypothetical protein
MVAEGGILIAHNYLVDLTETEQAYLLQLIHKGKPSARQVARAPVLVHAAAGRPMTRLRQFSAGVSRPCIGPASGCCRRTPVRLKGAATAGQGAGGAWQTGGVLDRVSL